MVYGIGGASLERENLMTAASQFPLSSPVNTSVVYGIGGAPLERENLMTAASQFPLSSPVNTQDRFAGFHLISIFVVDESVRLIHIDSQVFGLPSRKEPMVVLRLPSY